MRLTVHTDYALRTLMVLAAAPGQRHTIEDIARRFRISRDHLGKVAQTLVRSGLVVSHRGRSGGIALARPAAQVPLGAVLRATEEDFALVECQATSPRRRCVLASGCGLPAPLQEAMDAFFGVLDRYSVADLLQAPAWRRLVRRAPGSSAPNSSGA
jgi:Rrf2 family nitric oxide-sensitive transcriptional repressor